MRNFLLTPLAGVISFVFTISVMCFALIAQPVHAQEAATPAEASLAVVDGFRSAKFGMNADEVRAAIKTDFNMTGDAVSAGENLAERTGLLTIRTEDVLPDGGPAVVSYVFGHTSKKLIQVGVLWDPQPADEGKLLANAEVLSAYFRAGHYKPESIRTGLVTENGVVMFRGEDEKGRSTVLLLQGNYIEGENKERTLSPTALALLYAVDPQNPDIFRIDPGQF